MMNKVFVKLYVPLIEKKYEVFIPINKQICDIIKLLVKAIHEMTGNDYVFNTETGLYDRNTGLKYNQNLKVVDVNIKNGVEIVLI